MFKLTPLFFVLLLAACDAAMSPQEIAERQTYCTRAGAKQVNIVYDVRTKNVYDVRCVFSEYQTPSRNCFEQRKAGGKC